MSELRRDPILRRWVVIAPERAADLAPRRWAAEPPAEDPCPFCPGNEHLNPVEIAVVGDRPRWRIRITPDKEPLLRIEGDLARRGAGMFDRMNAIGAHELVTDTPDHTLAWADFPLAQMTTLLETYRARVIDLRRDPRFRHVLVLKNHGAAWSHYEHAHSHVIATPFTPKRLEEELAGAREYYRMKERCVFCDQIDEELAASTRIVARNEHFVAMAPFASAHPYETWLLPLHHAADFATPPDRPLAPLAELLVDILARIRDALGDPPYSLALHGAPSSGGEQVEFHWHLELVPHVGQEIGMEWATGIFSNPVPPESAAERLRAARRE